MRTFIRTCAAALSAVIMIVMGSVAYYGRSLPDKFYTHDGTLNINGFVTVSGEKSGGVISAAGSVSGEKKMSLKILGLFPVKDARVERVAEKLLVPCGTPFGIKLNTDGVLVVGMGEVKTPRGVCCPAREAGIKEGDAIMSVNDKTVYTNEDIEAIVKASSGDVGITVRRGGRDKAVKVTPVTDDAGEKRVGLWVRDSSAGIGTITYYDPQTSQFGGLGHPICDVDTGQIMPLLTGQVVRVVINDVVKGEAGDPGELKGSFVSRADTGVITSNSETGVFGTLYKKPSQNAAVPVGLKQDIKEGPAEIYATVSGTAPKAYDIDIEKVNISDTGKTKNMIIRVTDARLLEKTGGIVQGMSGSPIIQNGRLIGAVTHVLVNDPEKGYGIFIENMFSINSD